MNLRVQGFHLEMLLRGDGPACRFAGTTRAPRPLRPRALRPADQPVRGTFRMPAVPGTDATLIQPVPPPDDPLGGPTVRPAPCGDAGAGPYVFHPVEVECLPSPLHLVPDSSLGINSLGHQVVQSVIVPAFDTVGYALQSHGEQVILVICSS